MGKAAILIALMVFSTSDAIAQTYRFSSPNGRTTGHAVTYGRSTYFYAPNGRIVGSATRIGR